MHDGAVRRRRTSTTRGVWLSVGIFGLGAAIVVWRTGGLEAGIALHSVNNIAGFLLLASGVHGTTVNPKSSSSDLGTNLSSLAVTLSPPGWVLWIERLARRHRLGTLGGMLAAPAASVQSRVAQASLRRLHVPRTCATDGSSVIGECPPPPS